MASVFHLRRTPRLVDAIAATLPGAAGSAAAPTSLRNLLTRVPKAAQGLVATMVRSIFAQPDADSVFEQHRRIVRRSRTASPRPSCCSTRPPQILAPSPAFPKEHWRHPWSNNSLERLNKEIRRRTDVVGIFPDRAAIVRLAGALPAEQHDEWQVARRYMSADSIAKALAHPFTNPRRRSPSKQPPERQARMTRSASDTT